MIGDVSLEVFKTQILLPSFPGVVSLGWRDQDICPSESATLQAFKADVTTILGVSGR